MQKVPGATLNLVLAGVAVLLMARETGKGGKVGPREGVPRPGLRETWKGYVGKCRLRRKVRSGW
jgi:hypothetical protein